MALPELAFGDRQSALRGYSDDRRDQAVRVMNLPEFGLQAVIVVDHRAQALEIRFGHGSVLLQPLVGKTPTSAMQ